MTNFLHVRAKSGFVRYCMYAAIDHLQEKRISWSNEMSKKNHRKHREHADQARIETRREPSWQNVKIVRESVDPEQAKTMVMEGTRVGWDDCGSRGFAGLLTWLDDHDNRRLADSNPPELQYGGNILEVELPDGQRALIAELPFKWGSVF